jgi:hypothetical protein
MLGVSMLSLNIDLPVFRVCLQRKHEMEVSNWSFGDRIKIAILRTTIQGKI